ncbi:MAG: hypothetical protein Q7S51_09800 [Gallionellaceae bacterium]|nr:hypothetical protein [Gallionellaceae bacterium]
MRNTTTHTLAFAAILLFAASLSYAADLDKRLVGVWQGQRSAESKCSFQAWEITRTYGGKFEIIRYTDSNKTKEVGRERGIWWVKASEYYAKTLGAPTPNGYNYVLLNQDKVRYTVLKGDPSADCKADYEFTEQRIIGAH